MIENVLLRDYPNQMWTISGFIADDNDWNQNVFWSPENTIPKPEWSEIEPLLNEYKISSSKTRKLTELSTACSDAIRAGFVSDALGYDYWYSTAKDEDQVNLTFSSLSGLDQKFVCTEVSTGIKSLRMHTGDQMQKVGQDGAKAKTDLIEIYYEKVAAVEAATTTEEIEAITW